MQSARNPVGHFLQFVDCGPFLTVYQSVCVTSHGAIFSRRELCPSVFLAGVGIWRGAPENTGCLLRWKESLVQHNRSFVLQREMVNCVWLHEDLVSVNIWLSWFQTFRHFRCAFIYFEKRLHSYSLANFEPPPQLSSICLWNVRLNQRRLVQTGRRACQKSPRWQLWFVTQIWLYRSNSSFTPKNVNIRYQAQSGRFWGQVIALECLRNVPQTIPDGVCGVLVHIILPMRFQEAFTYSNSW